MTEQMDQSELLTAVLSLASSVEDLSKRADTQQEMLERVEHLTTDTHRNRTGLKLAAAGVIAVFALSVFCAWLFIQVDANTHRVEEIQARTSTEILCPLYEFLALSLKVNPANPSASSEQLELRRTAADTIASGLKTLGCV